jgi:hypothetical protein
MKRSLPIKNVSADLAVLYFPAAPGKPVRTRCLNCSVSLSLSQPDPDLPEQLLGVCKTCKHWFLIHLRTGEAEGLLWQLPDIELIRHLFFEPRSHPFSQ